MSWVDIAVIAIPLLIALLVYALVNSTKKPGSSAPVAPSPSASALPTVTITANQILLDEAWAVVPRVRGVLDALAKRSSLYVIVCVESMAQMRELRPIVERELDGVVSTDQILFCETNVGRASMARQLEVLVHFDFDPEAIRQVAIFHKAVLVAHRGAYAPEAVCACESLEEFAAGRMKALFPALA
jgi:hypothetical protein